MDRRPELHVIAPGASVEEVAAIVGALESDLERTRPQDIRTPQPSPWLQAALAEGVARAPAAVGRGRE